MSILSQLDDNLSRVVCQAPFVLNVPTKRLEKWRNKINASLSLGIVLREIVNSV